MIMMAMAMAMAMVMMVMVMLKQDHWAVDDDHDDLDNACAVESL